MRTIKHFGVLFLCGFVFVLFAAFSACSSTDSEKPEEPKKTLTLDRTEMSLLIGDELTLKATYDEVDGETLLFDSSDDGVASVSETGKVTAIARGEATITVTYGDLTKTCFVIVGLGAELPVLSLSQIEGNETTVTRGDTLNFESYVSFNGKTFTDATIVYEFSDETVATMNGNVLTPVKVGETSVTLKATWHGETGATLEKTVKVAVVDEVNLFVNDGLTDIFTVYTAESFAGETFDKTIPFETYATANGASVDCTVTPLENTLEYVALEGGVLTAKAEGVAKFRLSCTVGEGETAKEYAREITVNVVLPVADYQTPVNFSAFDKTVDFATIFGEEVTVVKAVSDGNELSVNGNLLEGLVADSAKVLEKKVSVYTRTCGYNLTLRIYTRILDEAEDLAIFDLATATTVIDGQYLLGDDLDASKVAPIVEHRGYAVGGGSNSTFVTTATVGFKGTFDGNGKTLKLQVGCMGLFGKLLDGAVIKNLALEATHTTKTHAKLTSSVFAHTLEDNATGNGVTIENTYIKVLKTVATSYNTSVIGTRVSMLFMTNVVVENKTIDETKNGGALFFADATRKYTDTEKTPALTKVQAKLSNVYVISESDCMAKWGAATVADGVTTVKAIVANNVDRTNYVLTDNSTYAYTGVNVYADYTALSAVSFENMPWTVDASNGTLVWKK